MTTLAIRQALIVDGNIEQGDVHASTTISLTAGQSYVVEDLVVEDGFGETKIWETGEGGMTLFEKGYILSDIDCWVQLENDDTGSNTEKIRFQLFAGIITPLPPKFGGNTVDETDGVAWSDNTEFADCKEIWVHNDNAADGGDATVSLYLFA